MFYLYLFSTGKVVGNSIFRRRSAKKMVKKYNRSETGGKAEVAQAKIEQRKYSITDLISIIFTLLHQSLYLNRCRQLFWK